MFLKAAYQKHFWALRQRCHYKYSTAENDEYVRMETVEEKYPLSVRFVFLEIPVLVLLSRIMSYIVKKNSCDMPDMQK